MKFAHLIPFIRRAQEGWGGRRPEAPGAFPRGGPRSQEALKGDILKGTSANGRKSHKYKESLSWWTFRIFLFFCREKMEGGVRRAGGGGGVRISIKNPRMGGGGLPKDGEGADGAGRVSEGNWGRVGLNIFFGAEIPSKLYSWDLPPCERG